MVLIEPIFLPEKFYQMKLGVADHPLAAKAIKRTSSWSSEKEALEYLKSRALFASWDEQVLDLYFKYGMQRQENGSLHLTCSPESEAAIFMGGRKYNPWPLLDKLKCPVLIVEGEKSENKQFIDLKKAVPILRQGQYRSVAGAGHLIPMQKPQIIAQIIKDFMSDIANI
jgi:pimeloyl-ACP methyl ester carboxylesterase